VILDVIRVPLEARSKDAQPIAWRVHQVQRPTRNIRQHFGRDDFDRNRSARPFRAAAAQCGFLFWWH
jgi:hypothetical protein